MKELNLGLDLGTNSIGWALVDENGDVVKKNGFRFWGVRMFDEASTAKERRGYRTSRRRLRRRRQRIEWLQDEFRDEIVKIDPKFFQRINESFYKVEDKTLQNKHTFFDDTYTDKEYFDTFPTIYHLRKYLMETSEKADIRMLYLAIHHIIKYRGHFLNEGESFNPSDSSLVKEVFDEINSELIEYANKYEDDEDYFQRIELKEDDYEKIQEIMLSKSSKMEKENKLRELMNVDKKTLVNEFLIKLLVNGKTSPKSYTFVKEQKYDTKDIVLNDEEIESIISENKKTISELSTIFDYVENVKLISDFYFLLKLLGKNKSLSEAMIATYDKHQKDLSELKNLIKTYLKEKYDECFRVYDPSINNYVRYVGILSTNGDIKRFAHCKKEDFEKYIKKLLSEIKDDGAQETINNIISRIDNGDYLPRQNSGQNTTIPMQLNLLELKKILENQSKHYPFLLEKIDGLTRNERIISIFEYHIPYYVGPLSNVNNNQFSWIERKPEPIRPWNFNEVVDIEASATNFIQRMQNKCTYLQGANDYCLPKMSLLFSEYNCLQYLNKLRINGVLINVDIKNHIFEDLFLKEKAPTKKKIKEFLQTNYNVECDEIPEVNCNMSSWIRFKEIFGEEEFNKRKDDNTIEEIIKDITLFEDKKILVKRLKEIYHLNDAQIKQIKGLTYKGYGALCRKLLNELKCINNETGEVSPTIIEIMRETNLNLQEIINSEEYPFKKAIDEYNIRISNDNVDYKTFIDENLYVSPMMKRSLIQAYKIIEEIERIFKRPINKYYIECARSNKQKKVPTDSRYKKIRDLYDACAKITDDLRNVNIDFKKLSNELDAYKDKMSIDSLYLYFTQFGKCMYTLNDITSVNDVIAGIGYDIDHIYPQSLVSDDSLSNRVLVEKNVNQSIKNNRFLCETEIVSNRHRQFYKMLLEKGMITKEKYRRLTEREVDETTISGFANRQLVSTNQSVIGLIQLLKKYKHINDHDIIYSKAENISDFRNEYDMLKSRTANNFHHAHDAYLNVVVGRAINTYYEVNRIFGQKDILKLQNEKKTLNPMTIVRKKIYDLKGRLVWDLSIHRPKIEKYLYGVFDIHETTRTYTSNKMFSKISVLPKGEGTVMIKSSDPKMSIDKYGGITSHSYCKYCIVEALGKKDKKEYILESIPTSFKDRTQEYIDLVYSSKYKQYNIIKDNIPTNLVIREGALKYYITGKTGDCYLTKNANDRIFSKKAIGIIRAIDKYNEQKQKKCEKEPVNNVIIVSPSKELKNGKTTKEISITMNDCLFLINEIKVVYSKEIFAFSTIINLVNKLSQINDFETRDIKDLVYTISQILLLLKTNERKICDLSKFKEFARAKNYGNIYLNKKLSSNQKLICESPTGYFTEMIFEVPDGI